MEEAYINFFTEDVEFEIPKADKRRQWIDSIIRQHEKEVVELNYILGSDEYIHKINLEYLDHDDYTDIITFDNSEEESVIEADIFISLDRIRENAKKYGVTFEDELDRVLIHGVLHLLGYGDKTEEDKQEMRQKEDECLSLRI
jgi:rRNA maturation RNase YbeY